MSKESETLDKKMKGIYMQSSMKGVEKVLISLTDAVEVEPGKGEEESRTKTREYTAKSNHFPHLDFINAMKALAEPALDVCEMNITKSDRNNYIVMGIDIKGDLFMNQARVTFKMGKLVERSEKIIKWTSPQVTLSADSKYLDWKNLQKKVQTAIDEAWLFLAGKHSGDSVKLAFDMQLPLFVPEKEETEQSKHRRKERKIQPQEPNVPGMMASPGVA